MRTIKDEWENFKTKSYPNGMTPSQEEHIYRAFIAGAWVMGLMFTELSVLSDEQGEKELAKLLGESNKAVLDILSKNKQSTANN